METFGEKLLRREIELNLSQEQAADKAGVSPKTIQRLESDDPKATRQSKLAVARALGIEYDPVADTAPLRRGPSRKSVDRNVEPYSERKLTVDPPLFELTIHASRWDELRYEDDDGGAVATDAQIKQGMFLARIRGDCMEPKWRDGLVVPFRLLRNESGRPDFSQMRLGGSYYVQLGNGEATFKSLAEDSEDEIVLMPLNPKYKKTRLRALKEDVQRLAVAIE